MKRYVSFQALAIAAIVLAWLGVGRMVVPMPQAAAVNSTIPPQGLGMKYAGAWIFDLYLGGSATPTVLVMNVNADGTILLCGGSMADGTSVSTAHGSWKMAGPNTMVGNFASLGFNADASFGWYEKGPFLWTLSRDGNRLEGPMTIGIYSPDQDILTEDPAWGIIPCNCVARRLPAE